MTAELVLLLAIYGALILGLFLGPDSVITTFQANAPRLSVHIERNIATGSGFWSGGAGGGLTWKKP